MKKNRRPIQRSLDVLAPLPVAKGRVGDLLIGEPFVSPIARIPTNRGLLLPAEKPR
jgi:hypothetical protein